ncbi:putative cytochrome P450 313a4, partial [Gonioctena quinquepunctata]
RRLYLKKYGNNIKVAPYLPFVGSAYLFIRKDFLNSFLDLTHNIGTSYLFWLFHKPFYYTSDPKEFKEILTNSNALEKGCFYDSLRTIVANCLLIVEEKIWKKHRKGLSKCFKQKVLNKMIPIFNRNTDELLQKIHSGRKIENTLEWSDRFFYKNFFDSILMFGFGETSVDPSEIMDHDVFGILKEYVFLVSLSKKIGAIGNPKFVMEF